MGPVLAIALVVLPGTRRLAASDADDVRCAAVTKLAIAAPDTEAGRIVDVAGALVGGGPVKEVVRSG